MDLAAKVQKPTAEKEIITNYCQLGKNVHGTPFFSKEQLFITVQDLGANSHTVLANFEEIFGKLILVQAVW